MATNEKVLDIPVNLNGILKVSVGDGISPEDIEALAVAAFTKMLRKDLKLGEGSGSTASFVGESWSTAGQARVGDLQFEVRHDLALQTSGAMVALAPAPGAYGANRYRAKVTAYVSREAVFITARDARTDGEKIMVAVTMESGEPTVSVMDPNAEDEFSATHQPIYSTSFPGMSCSLN